jgi:hypothetical protein
MVLLPCSPCCHPCDRCDAVCLRVTFSDFDEPTNGITFRNTLGGTVFIARRSADPLFPCVYFSDEICCAWDTENRRAAWLTIDASTPGGLTITIWEQYRGTPPPGVSGLTVTASWTVAYDPETPHRARCEDMVFEVEGGGTITIAEADCEEVSHGPACDMPDAVTLALAGSGNLVFTRVWAPAGDGDVCGGAAEVRTYCTYYPFCGDRYTIFGKWLPNQSAVLDRVAGTDHCGPWRWEGLFPAPTCPGGSILDQGGVWHDWEDAISTDPIAASVSIGQIDAGTVVSIAAPTRGGATAEAVVSTIDGGGSITAIGLSSPGSNYAVRRVVRAEPTVTATTTEGTTPPTLAVTLVSRGGDDPARWAVSAVAVTDGGAGHPDESPVEFSTDDEAEWHAFAWAYAGRVAPGGISAVVAGGTTPCEISLWLEAVVLFGRTYWKANGIDVDSPGAGFTEGAEVALTFTDPDDVEVVAAIITVHVDGSGGVVGFECVQEGYYYKSTGVIESVLVGTDFGVSYSGAYWRNVVTDIVDADDPDVSIWSPVGGGATATVTVDTTIGSPTFGQITAVNLTAGGADYKITGKAWVISASGEGGASSLFSGFASYHRQQMPAVGEMQAAPSLLLPMSGRTTTDVCPTSLFDRALPIAVQIGTGFVSSSFIPRGYTTAVHAGGMLAEFTAGTPITLTASPA